MNVAVREHEKKKGNVLISLDVKKQISIPNNGTQTQYTALCIKKGQDSSKTFSVFDSVIVYKTGDGIYTTN